MKKIILVFFVFLSYVSLFGEDVIIPYNSFLKKPDKIIYLHSNDNIKYPGFGYIDMSEGDNWIIAEKEADENHVRVIFKRKDLEYPDVELIENNSNIYKGVYYYEAKYKSKYGVIDTNGKILIPFEFDNPVGFATDDYYYFTKNGLFGIIDKSHKIIIPCEYKFLKVVNDKYIYCKKNHKNLCITGIIDYNNNVIIPCEYLSLEYVNDDFIIANINQYNVSVKDQKFENGYIINIKNEILKKYRDPVYLIRSGNDKIYSKNLLWTNYKLIDLEDNIIFGNIWMQNIYAYISGLVCEFAGEKFVVNYDGKIIYRGSKENQIVGRKNSFTVYDNKKKLYGLIDLNGKTLVENNFEKCFYPNYTENNKKIYEMDEYDYLAFVNKDKSILVNLNTFEKKEFDLEISKFSNEGIVYVQETIKGREGYKNIPIN